MKKRLSPLNKLCNEIAKQAIEADNNRRRISITYDWLKRQKACPDYLKKFRRVFGKGGFVTLDKIIKASQNDFPLYFISNRKLKGKSRDYYAEMSMELSDAYMDDMGVDYTLQSSRYNLAKWQLLFIALNMRA